MVTSSLTRRGRVCICVIVKDFRVCHLRLSCLVDEIVMGK